MQRRAPIQSSAGVLPAVLLLAGCASFEGLSGVRSFRQKSDQDVGLSTVDDLVAEVERIHLEAEVSRERVREAHVELRALVAADYQGDPVAGYVSFLEAVERSKSQAGELSDRADPLEQKSAELFTRWGAELDEFTLPSLSQRSRARLEETRERLLAVQTALAEALKAYAAYNTGLSDVATFLGHDFNAAAVAEISVETKALADYSSEVHLRLASVMEAAEAYAGAAALPGTVEVEEQESVAAAKR